MTKEKWDVDDITTEEVVNHLVEHHSVPFNDRASLNFDEFVTEHFPRLLKDITDKNLVYESLGKNVKGHYLSGEGRERLGKARAVLRKALKYCEENAIPIAKVLDEVKTDNDLATFEWRICKPTQEELSVLKFKRWFTSAEGYFNKAVLQEGMLEDLGPEELDLLVEQLKDTIKNRRVERELKAEKKKRKAERVENEN